MLRWRFDVRCNAVETIHYHQVSVTKLDLCWISSNVKGPIRLRIEAQVLTQVKQEACLVAFCLLLLLSHIGLRLTAWAYDPAVG